MAHVKEYLVQPQMYADRKANYDLGQIINKKWKAISGKKTLEINPEGTCANIGTEMQVNINTKKIKFSDQNQKDTKYVTLYESISAALALYRTICMINRPKVETEGAKGYKFTWRINLLHVETGEVFGISEWKGGFGIWTKFYNKKQLPESFKNDIEEFMNLLLSEESPHPYDGCTAGAVA